MSATSTLRLVAWCLTATLTALLWVWTRPMADPTGARAEASNALGEAVATAPDPPRDGHEAHVQAGTRTPRDASVDAFVRSVSGRTLVVVREGTRPVAFAAWR